MDDPEKMGLELRLQLEAANVGGGENDPGQYLGTRRTQPGLCL